jgi:integrase
MTPSRTGKGKGNLEFDRRFPGVGRIRCSSGVAPSKSGKIPAEFHARNALLSKLFKTSQLEILRAFMEGHLTIEQLVEHDRHGRGGETIAVLKLNKPLWETTDELLPRMGRTRGTRERYALSLRQLRLAVPTLGARATVADLGTVDWTAVRDAWANGPADFNRMRSAVSRFLSLVTGDKYSPFRRSVMAAFPRDREPEGRVPDLAPAQFVALLTHVDDDVKAALMTMALAGLRVGEYLSLDRPMLQPANHRILVPDAEGNKTGGRVVSVHADDWGWIVAAVPFAGRALPATRVTVDRDPRYRRLRTAWRAAQVAEGLVDADGRPALRLHDLKHCTGQWASDAGQADRSIQSLLGHKDPRMTARYTKQKDARSASRAVGATLRRLGGG